MGRLEARHRRLDLGVSDAKPNKRISLLRRRHTLESDSESSVESDEDEDEDEGHANGDGDNLKFSALLKAKADSESKTGFSFDYAQIVLHKKHIMPNLVQRQQRTLKSSYAKQLDQSWIQNYNADKYDYNSVSVHTTLKLREVRVCNAIPRYPGDSLRLSLTPF